MDDATAAAPDLARTFVASALVLFAGLALLLMATEGGNAFTTETLRRAAVERQPRPVPDFIVLDDSGRAQSLRGLIAHGERIWIVDFMYTRCRTVCTALGSVYQQLQRSIVERGLQGRVGLLSISFDPQHDDAAALRDYARRLRLDPSAWRAVSLASPADRRELLDAFGILVIPAEAGEFEHNAALHLVDARARLVRIVDDADPAAALDAALAAAP